MKTKYKTCLAIVLVFIVGLAILSPASINSKDHISLTVTPSKTTYKPGEVVYLTFEIKNTGSKEIIIGDIFGVGGGMLSVHTSKDGKTYQKYTHPGWGLVDYVNPETTILPGASLTTKASILWRWRGDDPSEYLFPESGGYYVKAQYYVNDRSSSAPNLIESKPVNISIDNVAGDDLLVWNEIKGNGDFAFFLQHGDFSVPSYRTEERVKFQQKVEDIIARYPNSFYAQSLQQSLAKFKEAELKRNEFMNRVREQQKKP